MYSKNDVIKMGESIYRVLVTKVASVTGLPEYFCIDCKKKTMPKWFSASDLELSSLCSEEESQIVLGDSMLSLEDLGAEEKKTAHERYSVISAVLPFVGDKMQSQAINKVAEENNLSRKTVTNYLCQYLVYQSMTALAPKKAPEQSLTKDQKNIRWALNKFYYTKNKNSLTEAYTMMLKAKYTDDSGSLLPEYPSLHQFKYYYRQNKSLQKEYIRRGGIKDYEMNHRPLLGDGVRQFAPAVGVGMLDATICDIYLCDDSGNLVGRPILVACVDAYSGLCCGYSLLWEGGMYSLRDLMLNCITDKVEWCRQFGIAIDKADWDCAELPGTLVTDMGTEYKSFNFEQMADLGCRIVNLPSFRPELKGPVEKFFDLIQDTYKPYLKNKGVIEPDFQKRGSHDYRKDASLTIRQFEQIIIHCILYYNNQRIVENFPYTAEMLEQNIKPHASDIWNYGRTQAGANLIEVTREQLILTMLPRASAKFTRKGLQVNKLRYSADGFTEQYLKGGSVTVAYNPEDVGCVWLLRAGEYIRFDLIESRFEGQTLLSVQDLQQRQKALVRNHTEENTKAKVELAQHIEAIASHGTYSKDVNMKGISKTRQRQKEQRHKDFTQELNQGEAIYG